MDELGVELDRERAVLTLNRPARKNALTQAMWAGLPDVLAGLAREPRAKVLVIRGAGGMFAAGADILEFETAYATPDSARAYFRQVAEAMDALARFEKPTLALIEGDCIGGGLGLALCCDLRFASGTARLALTPARLGLAYSLEDTRRLVQAVGPSMAKDILFTGRRIGAEEGLRIGLVDALLPAAEIEGAVFARADEIAAASQWSVRRAKAMIARIQAGQVSDTEETRGWLVEATEGEDFQEGFSAFRAKRTPVFPFR